MKKRNFLLVLSICVTSLLGVLTAQQLKQLHSPEVGDFLKKNPKVIVLDVRTVEEFQMGHLKGARNIDIRQSDFMAKVSELNKKNTYLVYCRTNHRSSAAVEYMIQQGFTQLYQMVDGYSGWTQNNYSYVK